MIIERTAQGYDNEDERKPMILPVTQSSDSAHRRIWNTDDSFPERPPLRCQWCHNPETQSLRRKHYMSQNCAGWVNASLL